MSTTYFCSVPATGPDDLVSFRDAAVTYAASRRGAKNLLIEASDSAWDLLSWLGIEGQRGGAPQGVGYQDPRRLVPPGVEVRALASWGIAAPSLESFRQQGGDLGQFGHQL